MFSPQPEGQFAFRINPDSTSSIFIPRPNFTTLATSATYANGKDSLPENETTAINALVIPNRVKADAVVELQGNLKKQALLCLT